MRLNRTIQMIMGAVVLFAVGGVAFAATYYVAPTGAGSYTGADWGNAFSNVQ